MTNGAAVGGAIAAAGAVANAVKASGAIVRVEPQDFEAILENVETPLVVTAEGGLLTTRHHYLTSYKGLIFYTKTQTPLPLPAAAEVVAARSIWLPE